MTVALQDYDPAQATRCPVETTVSMIGGKWKPIILFQLAIAKRRYSELRRNVPGISDRMLSRSLKELEGDGVVQRTVFAEVPVRVEYSLTPEGETLIPVLNAMVEWVTGRDHTR